MELFTLDNLITLAFLILLQAVLGFDNLLYIAIESRRVAPEHQALVRQLGIGIAVFLRIALLFAVLKVIEMFQEPFFQLRLPEVIEGSFNLQALVVLIGGAFLLYTATKEIMHMIELETTGEVNRRRRSVAGALFWIVSMNLVFSFDSILSAMALTDQFVLMATAISIGGVLMIWLSDRVAEFLKRNRMYEVLGLFILFIVGVMLVSEGGHLAGLKLFGYAVTPMTKTTFYFVIFVLVLVDVVQSQYRKKLAAANATRNT